MFTGLINTVSDTLQEGVNRLLDKELKIGVTGLSRGGKSAFITALVNTILNFGNEGMGDRLARFREYEQAGIYYGGIAPSLNLAIPSFPYQESMDHLLSDPPRWPRPTDSISSIRLEVKFRENRLLVPGKSRSIFLDICDYPGEWLLDLVLLNLSYEEFSARMRDQAEKLRTLIPLSARLLEEGWRLKPEAPADPQLLHSMVGLYVDWLKECRDRGLALIVPGRFILPGALAGAPIIEFVPWLWQPVENPGRDSLYRTLKLRYETYRKEIVEKFYSEVFSHLDRQIILIDCFHALGSGQEAYSDLTATFQALIRNFSYGDSNFLTRLFSPKIDKVIFAATKADCITLDEAPHLLSLLKSMVSDPAREMRGSGSRCEFMVLSAIACTKCLEVNFRGQPTQVLSTGREGEKWFYPGSIPPEWSRQSMQDFREHFIRRELLPPILRPGEPIPNINLDLVLSYLMRDKL